MELPLLDGHKVLGEENYCSGFIDSFGKWKNGFPCPELEGNEPVFCCGTDTHKYCCVKPKHVVNTPFSHLALLLGIAFSIIVAIAFITVVSCFHCSCCFFYKKRQPTSRGSVYQLECPSTITGVANMYSFSRSNTPSEISRSLSRASSSGRSRLTNDSSSRTLPLYDFCELRNTTGLLGHSLTSPEVGGSHSGSLAMSSEHSASTVSDATVRENLGLPHRCQRGSMFTQADPPPPYSAPHSTLMAVRTPSTFGVLRSIPEPHTPPSMHARNTIAGIEDVLGNNLTNERSQLQTFPQTSGIMTSSSSSGAIASLASTVRIPSVRFLNNSSSISSNINSNNNNHIYSNTINAGNNNGIQNNQRRLHVQPQLQNQGIILSRLSGEGFTNQTYALNQTYGLNQPISVISNSLPQQTAGPCSATQIITPNSGIGEDRRLYTATKF